MSYIQPSDYRAMCQRGQIEQVRLEEEMVHRFTFGGACYFCGYNGSPGWLHDADTDEIVESCPVCNAEGIRLLEEE